MSTHTPPVCRPEHLIVTHLAVPPVCIRPSVEMESAGSNEDDITMKLMQIIEARASPVCGCCVSLWRTRLRR